MQFRITDMVLRLIRVWPLLLLAGCVDVSQEFWIAADGSARLEVVYSSDIAMFQQWQALVAEERDCRKGMEAFRARQRGRGVVVGEATTTVSGNIIHCRVEVQIANILDYRGSIDDEDERFNSWWFEKQGEELLYRHRYGARENPATIGRATQPDLYRDKFFTIVIHAPQVHSRDGVVTAAGNQVQWRIPLLEYADTAPRTQLQATIRLSPGRHLPRAPEP